MRQLIFSASFGVIFIMSLITDAYGFLGISLLALLLLLILYKMGRGIVLLEVTAILYVLTCVIMPLIGYEYYSYNDPLSKLWVRYMPVKPAIYFPYTLPAVAGFCLAITLPPLKKQLPDEGLVLQDTVRRIRMRLLSDPYKGIRIMIVGTLISLITKLLPDALNYFAILFFFGSFAGLLYVLYSTSFRYKNAVIVLFMIFIMINALQTGMFTIVAYMGITIFSFFQLGKNISILKKAFFLVATIAIFIVLQNVKMAYRKNTWNKTFEGSRTELFSDLVLANVNKGDALLDKKALFPLYSRTNQGYQVAMVMHRIPLIKPYDGGERLLTVFASAFVPRFLWPDKPEAGGKFNMKYYAGFDINGWSTNIGPLGEAYGSFGSAGGIVYMILLGLFLRWAYFRVFVLARKNALLICWLPVLFYQITSSAETDTLQILNSIIKSSFFIWLLSKFLPRWFGIVREEVIRRMPVKEVPA